MNEEMKGIYTLGTFGKETSSALTQRFSGKRNLTLSLILIAITAVIAVVNTFLFGVVSGIIRAIVLVLTAYALIEDIKKGSAFRDIGSCCTSLFSGIFGKGTPAVTRVMLILSATAFPLLFAWLLSCMDDIGILLGLCIFISSRNGTAFCLRLADGVCGSVSKKNFDRTAARRYLAGFGAGLLIFSAVFSVAAAIKNDGGNGKDDGPQINQEADVNFTVSSKTGTVGELHKSILAFNSASEKYNVIVETVRYDETVELYYRTYALWHSKDVDEFNFRQYEVYSSATAKLTVASKDFGYSTAMDNFIMYMPWYGIGGMEEGNEGNRQMALLARYVIAGLMPELSDKELTKVCKKLRIAESDFEDMAKTGSVITENKRVCIARFGHDNMNFASTYYNAYHNMFEMTFTNVELDIGLS